MGAEGKSKRFCLVGDHGSQFTAVILLLLLLYARGVAMICSPADRIEGTPLARKCERELVARCIPWLYH